MALFAHADGALPRRSQRARDGRLDQRHQGHVGIGRDRDGAEQFRREHAGEIKRGRTVRAADNGDGRGLLQAEIEPAQVGQQQGAQQGREYADLGRGAENHRSRIGEQRPEVGQRAHAHENQQGENRGRQSDLVKLPQNAVTGGDFDAGYVGQQSAEGDRQQQQGFELLADGQIQQQQADQHHRRLGQVELIQSRVLP